MTWYIVRHAEKLYGGFYDSYLRHQNEPITQRGQEQARALIPYFAGKSIPAIYVSEYLRTLQTSDPLARHFKLTPIVDQQLNEIDNGLIDGLSEEEIQARFPEVWRGFAERNTDFRFPGGETGEEARNRIANFIEEKRTLHTNQDIVVISHEGLIRLLTCHILNLPVYKRWNFQVDFCGIMELDFQPDHREWKLVRFNLTVG